MNPFGNDRRLRLRNTPLDLLRSLPAGRAVPRFWLGAGRADGSDMRNAEDFGQLLQLRQPAVTVRLVPGGGHTMRTWRQLLPPMLGWMTAGLAQEVSRHDARPLRESRAPLAAAARKARHLKLTARRWH